MKVIRFVFGMFVGIILICITAVILIGGGLIFIVPRFLSGWRINNPILLVAPIFFRILEIAVLRKIMGIQIEIEGLEALEPQRADEIVILILPHPTNLGMFPSQAIPARKIARAVGVVKQQLLWHWRNPLMMLVAWAGYLAGAFIPINRKSTTQSTRAISTGVRLMGRNPKPFWILLFPDSRRPTGPRILDNIKNLKRKGVEGIDYDAYHSTLLPRPRGLWTIVSSLEGAGMLERARLVNMVHGFSALTYPIWNSWKLVGGTAYAKVSDDTAEMRKWESEADVRDYLNGTWPEHNKTLEEWQGGTLLDAA